ncbi:ankyrin repeat domain-containing protein [Sessilibacter corallicola]|uniref:ankyrin repeat domain-containing protein n=1 Tax=Sessilibacter corallicola TaxID=2904075 RepID=UPI001E500EE3|nr:ankyrin repeat domain-containing protein [Sessilibacter corallicola]MCE2029676.1 ankyrin repeat domain-containing protein [Sessilibacter corallicola]
MSYFKRISVKDADHILATRSDVLLLDIRSESHYREGHHPKAILLDELGLQKLIRKTSKSTALIIYCYHGNSSQDIARLLSDFGFNDCYSVDGGYSAWCHQIDSEFPISDSVNKWMSEKGIENSDVDARLNSQYETALMLAARRGNTDLVRDFILCGADPNLKDSRGNNALWYACLSQNIECVRTLINADVEVDNTNIYGFTALNYSIGMDDIFELLTDYMFHDSILRLSMYDKNGSSSSRSRTNEAVA